MDRSRILFAMMVPALAAMLALAHGTAGAQDKRLPPVRWGVFKNYQPVFIAKEKKFFDAEGVSVEFVGNFTSGPAIIQAAGADQVDAGHSATTGIIQAVDAGIRVVGVADSQTEFRNAPLMQWYVLDTNPIRTAADLKGKKIAINGLSGSFVVTLTDYLARNQMSVKDVQLVLMPHHHQEQALRTGQIDVAGLIDPYTALIQQRGGVRTLFKAVDVIGENQFSLVFFRSEFAARHPEAVARFVRAYTRAIDFIGTNPKEASDIMARAIGISANLEGIHRYTPGAEVRMADAAYWLDQMRRDGQLKAGSNLTPLDVVTTRFVDQ